MKGSSPASTCCSSSSASSSCAGYNAPPNRQLQPAAIPKSKRSKRNHNHPDKCRVDATSSPGPGRSSIYRGVTRHRWTGRFEAHLWDKSSWNSIQNKKGRQVYLGAYDNEEAAAHTYDLAALKYWGPQTTLNFPIETYTKELQEMQKVGKEEYLASLRRRSSGFSRGVSKYRGVARHHHNGRWEARIGRVLGNKYLYLGTYNTQEEAAEAYDMAAIEYRGPNAVTNFDIGNYTDRLKKKKGIPFPQEPHHDHTHYCCSAESEDAEAEVEQPSPPSVLQQQQQQLVLPPACDTNTASTPSVIPMEDTIDGHDHFTWGFCLESAGLGLMTTPFSSSSSSSSVVPDLPLGNACCELPDLFDDRGPFEDNIDLIFDSCSYDSGAHMEYTSSDTSASGAEEAGGSAGSILEMER